MSVCYIDVNMKFTVREKFRSGFKKLLEQRGLTQAEFARLSKISKQHINNIINARRGGSDELKQKIADFFRMPIEDILALGAKVLKESYGEEEREPFPRYQEVMALSKDKRFDAIVQVAKEETGCPLVVFDPSLRERYMKGEPSEQEVYENVKRHMEAVKDAIRKVDGEE